jgi:hypothetical protein
MPRPCDAPRPTGFCFVSEAGDLVAGGASTTGEGPESVKISESWWVRGGVVLNVTTNAGPWQANFIAPNPFQLHPGLYEDAIGPRPSSDRKPVMFASPESSNCGAITGTFAVEELEIDPVLGITRVSVTFEEHCNGGTPALRGVINYQASGANDETVVPDQTIELGGWCSRVAHEAGSDFAYALDYIDNDLVKINLESGSLTRADVSVTPGDVCVDSARGRVFVVDEKSSLVAEYRSADLGLERSIPWGGSAGDPFYAHPRIYCAPDRVYLADGAAPPELFTMEGLDGMSPTLVSRGALGVGGLAWNAAGTDLYYWYRDAFNGGALWTSVHHILAASFDEVDATAASSPNFSRDPWNSPIFFDEARSLVVVKNRILDANDLHTLIQEMPQGLGLGGSVWDVTAFDPGRAVLASQIHLFELDGLGVLGTRLLSYSMDSFFDRRGRLWSLSEKNIMQVLVAEVVPGRASPR